MYAFSLSSFVELFLDAITTAAQAEDIPKRVKAIMQNVTWTIYDHVQRGLFVQDKIVFITQVHPPSSPPQSCRYAFSAYCVEETSACRI
jgi:carbamoylphosphate synthase small subunit